MSDSMNARIASRNFRWQLLTKVSAFALFGSVCGARESMAADESADHPVVWLELGGQLDHVSGQGDSFPVGFLSANPNSPVVQSVTPLQAQKPVPFVFGEEGKISFQPEGSDWVFSAAVNYGRSSNFKHVDHQTKGTHQVYKYGLPDPNGNILTQADFADTQAHHRESQAVLDFSVGKDVGLGMFGKSGSSAFSLGVRFAQFTSTASLDIRARPDLVARYVPSASAPTRIPLLHFHTYHLTGHASRSFHGIGPSLTWNGSTPVVGNTQQGEVTFDWSAGAAILFGKQKAAIGRQDVGRYFSALAKYSTVYHSPGGHNSDRSVTVPNAGGFAGASYRIENFKVSIGYRADFFFGAIDGGIDTAHRENVGFYGPFASISVGLGG